MAPSSAMDCTAGSMFKVVSFFGLSASCSILISRKTRPMTVRQGGRKSVGSLRLASRSSHTAVGFYDVDSSSPPSGVVCANASV